MDGIDKCRECRCGYVGSHFSCTKENNGKCDRFTNYGFEPKASCDYCGEWKYNKEATSIGVQCKNFKPKQHPLDEKIEKLIFLYQRGKISEGGIRHELKKLRYESIKWAFKPGTNSNIVDGELKAAGHEDWIV